MENVAHTLFGVIIGEGLARTGIAQDRGRTGPRAAPTADRQARVRAGLLWAACVGSNLPDADFVLRPLMSDPRLGYLLLHRGHTHTLLMIPLLGILAAAAGWVAFRGTLKRSSLQATWREWLAFFVAACLGLLGHIGADSWNDYGVHPFWPWSGRWFYGGFIFIAEPLFWFSLLPFAAAISRTRGARLVCAGLGLVGAAIVAIAAARGESMSWGVAAALGAWGFAWIGLYGRRPDLRHPAVAAFATVAVLATFSLAQDQVVAQVQGQIPPTEQVLRLSTTPGPGNPFCWRVLASTREGEQYRVRLGVATVWPWTNPERCYLRRTGENLSGSDVWRPATSTQRLQGPGLEWMAEYQGDLAVLRSTLQASCRARALMRFVKMPYWLPVAEGSTIVGDLRYHWGAGLGFADLATREGEDCPAWLPDWEPPSGLVDSGSLPQ